MWSNSNWEQNSKIPREIIQKKIVIRIESPMRPLEDPRFGDGRQLITDNAANCNTEGDSLQDNYLHIWHNRQRFPIEEFSFLMKYHVSILPLLYSIPVMDTNKTHQLTMNHPWQKPIHLSMHICKINVNTQQKAPISRFNPTVCFWTEEAFNRYNLFQTKSFNGNKV